MRKIVILAVSSVLMYTGVLHGMTNNLLSGKIKSIYASSFFAMYLPASQSINLQLTNVQSTSMTASWTRGSGTSCRVFVKANVINKDR